MENLPNNQTPIELYTIDIERDFARDCNDVVRQINDYIDQWRTIVTSQGDGQGGRYEPEDSPEGLHRVVEMQLQGDRCVSVRTIVGRANPETREYVFDSETGDLQVMRMAGEEKQPLVVQNDEERYAYLTDLSWLVFLAGDMERGRHE